MIAFLGTVTDVKPVLSNALSAILVTLPGIVIDFSILHPLKAYLSILFNPLGRDTDDRLRQRKKA